MTERSDFHHSSFVNRHSTFQSAVDIYDRLCDIAVLIFLFANLIIAF